MNQTDDVGSGEPANRPGDKGSDVARTNIRQWTGAAVGMVIGALVGLAVEFGVESTGILGPKVDALIEDQAANFDQINLKLDELSAAATTPEAQQLLGELKVLVDRQGSLAQETGSQLARLEQDRVSFKSEQLAAEGMSASIDFWLESGDSINVASRQQALALIRTRPNVVSVNVTGTLQNMATGDAVDIAGDDRSCRVILREIEAEAERAGFDIDCS